MRPRCDNESARDASSEQRPGNFAHQPHGLSAVLIPVPLDLDERLQTVTANDVAVHATVSPASYRNDLALQDFAEQVHHDLFRSVRRKSEQALGNSTQVDRQLWKIDRVQIDVLNDATSNAVVDRAADTRATASPVATRLAQQDPPVF